LLLKKAAKSKDVSPTGRVVAIVRRKWRQYCGILQLNPVPGSVRQIFVPAEKKIPKIRIETRQMDTLAGQRIIVAVDAWPRTSRYPVLTCFGLMVDLKNKNLKD
jgi:exosome complex exonuclease DIS3/RRP44